MSLRPYPAGELEAMWADAEARYAGDLVDNGGLAPEEAQAKAAKDTEWLCGLEPLLYEIEHEGVRVGRVVVGLDAFGKPGAAWPTRSSSTRRCAGAVSAAGRSA